MFCFQNFSTKGLPRIFYISLGQFGPKSESVRISSWFPYTIRHDSYQRETVYFFYHYLCHFASLIEIWPASLIHWSLLLLMKSLDAFIKLGMRYDQQCKFFRVIRQKVHPVFSNISLGQYGPKNRFCTHCIVSSLTPAKISWNWGFCILSLRKRPSFQTRCCKLPPIEMWPCILNTLKSTTLDEIIRCILFIYLGMRYDQQCKFFDKKFNLGSVNLDQKPVLHVLHCGLSNTGKN